MKLAHGKFSYNRTASRTTTYSPFEVVYGFNPYMPIDFITLSMDKFVHGNAKEYVEFMLNVHKELRKQIKKANEEYKKQANKNVHGTRKFKVRNLIWVHLHNERFLGQRKHKLMHRAEGPFSYLTITSSILLPHLRSAIVIVIVFLHYAHNINFKKQVL